MKRCDERGRYADQDGEAWKRRPTGAGRSIVGRKLTIFDLLTHAGETSQLSIFSLAYLRKLGPNLADVDISTIKATYTA